MNLRTQATDLRTLSKAYYRRAAVDGPNGPNFVYNRAQALRFEEAAIAIEGAIHAATWRVADGR